MDDVHIEDGNDDEDDTRQSILRQQKEDENGVRMLDDIMAFDKRPITANFGAGARQSSNILNR